MKMAYFIIFLLSSIISCKETEKMRTKYLKCVNGQIGKPFLEDISRGPDNFSNAGLIWYCRKVTGLPKTSTIYVNWKDVKKPIIGAHIYGIAKLNGPSVSTDLLGVIISLNQTYIVNGDIEKGILTKHKLELKKNI